jgi:hypothetical protein
MGRENDRRKTYLLAFGVAMLDWREVEVVATTIRSASLDH